MGVVSRSPSQDSALLPATKSRLNLLFTMADQKELEEAFKLFDADGDGLITSVELKALVEKVGGCMSEGEAHGLIHQADRDGNAAIDMSEFTKLWAAIRAEAQKCVAELDVDKDGRVSYPEFLLVYKYKKA